MPRWMLICFLFLVCAFSSALIVRTLVKSRQSLNNHQNGTTNEQRRSKDFKFAITSLSLNFIYISLKFPSFIFTLLVLYGSHSVDLINIGNLFYYFNYAIAIFTHLVSNSIFRNELLYLLRLKTENSNVVSATNNRILTRDNVVAPSKRNNVIVSSIA